MNAQTLGQRLVQSIDWNYVALVIVTSFFAFAKIYSEIKTRVVPLSAFWSIPFLLYLALVMPLSFLAFFSVEGDGGFPNFLDIILAAAAGVLGTIELAGGKIEGLGNAVRSLADSIKERIGIRIAELEIAEQSRLHGKLVVKLPDALLEREATFVGYAQTTGDATPVVKKWEMARFLIQKNPIRAAQLAKMSKSRLLKEPA